jgi:hypothetical protein
MYPDILMFCVCMVFITYARVAKHQKNSEGESDEKTEVMGVGFDGKLQKSRDLSGEIYENTVEYLCNLRNVYSPIPILTILKTRDCGLVY